MADTHSRKTHLCICIYTNQHQCKTWGIILEEVCMKRFDGTTWRWKAGASVTPTSWLSSLCHGHFQIIYISWQKQANFWWKFCTQHIKVMKSWPFSWQLVTTQYNQCVSLKLCLKSHPSVSTLTWQGTLTLVPVVLYCVDGWLSSLASPMVPCTHIAPV